MQETSARSELAKQKKDLASELAAQGMTGTQIARTVKERFGTGMSIQDIYQIKSASGMAPAAARPAPSLRAVQDKPARVEHQPRLTDLRSVLAMLRAAMLAEGFTRVTLTADGAVQAERQETFHV